MIYFYIGLLKKGVSFPRALKKHVNAKYRLLYNHYE